MQQIAQSRDLPGFVLAAAVFSDIYSLPPYRHGALLPEISGAQGAVLGQKRKLLYCGRTVLGQSVLQAPLNRIYEGFRRS